MTESHDEGASAVAENESSGKARRPLSPVRLAVWGGLLVGACLFAGYCLFWDGLPPDDADLLPRREAVPAARNAFEPIQAAAKAVSLTTAEFYAVEQELAAEHRHGRHMYKILARNERALALFDEAMALSELQVPAVTDSTVDLSYLERWQELGRLKALEARDQSYKHRLPRAARLLVTLCEFGWRLQGADGSMAHVSLGLRLQRLAVEELIRLVEMYEARMPPDVLIECADDLRQYRHNTAGVVAACRVEYAIWCADAEAIKARSYAGAYPGVKGLLKPYGTNRFGLRVNRTCSAYAEYWRGQIANLQRPYPERAPLPPVKKPAIGSPFRLVTKPNYLGRHLFWMISRPFARLRARIARNEAEVAAAQLFLAIRAYAVRHHKLPPDLKSLEGEFIEKLPVDPFSGAAWNYSPKKRVFYSVGENELDEGGGKRIGRRTRFRIKTLWLAPDPAVRLLPAPAADRGKNGGT